MWKVGVLLYCTLTLDTLINLIHHLNRFCLCVCDFHYQLHKPIDYLFNFVYGESTALTAKRLSGLSYTEETKERGGKKAAVAFTA